MTPSQEVPVLTPAEAELIYDWNAKKRRHKLATTPILFNDETLRDGIQGPSIVDPSLADKKRIVELADAIGIQFINLGLPGAGARAVEHVTALAKHIRDKKLAIRPTCAARTHHDDIRPIAQISQEVGMAIEVMAFLGTSPIRLYVESWGVDHLKKLTVDAVKFARAEGLPVTFVTEDTVRSTPTVLDPLFRAAIGAGAHRLCLCDTVGHATPDGVKNLIDFARHTIDSMGADVGLDWHGHNDRGLALTNTLWALEHGADRLHGTALGIGERVGNTALDQILVNLKLLGEIDNDLTKLTAWCHTVAQATRWQIPRNYPLMGYDAFRTATGVHAAAVIKAQKKGDAFLADRVYSGIPASWFGLQQVIEIGPMSGLSNVTHWLVKHGYTPDVEIGRQILAQAKASDRVLTDDELEVMVGELGGTKGGLGE